MTTQPLRPGSLSRLATLAEGGSSHYGEACETVISERLGGSPVLLMSSCTHALETCFLLLDIKPGDEVVTASFQFPSVANAIALRGGTPVFVDVDPDTLCLDVDAAAAAITSRTRAVVAMHYGGVGHDVQRLADLCHRRGVALVEDAAQAIGAAFAERPLGTYGAFATFSFHKTKNVQCGEGGALVVNDSRYLDAAYRVRDKGTDRRDFARGLVSRYRWTGLGSSYVLSEVQAAVLAGELEELDSITARRIEIWRRYRDGLGAVDSLRLLRPAPEAAHNAHTFVVIANSAEHRSSLLGALREVGVAASFHYQPLHSAPAGQRYGRFVGADRHTTDLANRLIRLPISDRMEPHEVERIIDLTSDLAGRTNWTPRDVAKRR